MTHVANRLNFEAPTLPNGISKVPQNTVVFWVVKILTTGMGETTSDFMVHQMDPPIAVAIGFLIFAAALVAQFAFPRYNTWVYWAAALSVSIFGTMAADVLHVGFGVPYVASTIFFLATLGVIFLVWFRIEGTLSIHSITTRRREVFYWATVLTTFALGTAAGDMTASSLGLGYLTSGLMFGAIILVPLLAWWRLGLAEIPAFWFAYVVTRPLGASFADWMGVSHERSGLDWGTGLVSLVLGCLIVAVLGYLSLTRSDAEPQTSVEGTRRSGV